ncbi:MAG: 50S ribosomal protein L20 [bacterium]
MRVKRGVTKRKAHKKLLKAVKGYRMKRSKVVSVAHEAFHHAGQYAFNGRRKKKGQLREIWIIRINAALGERMSYSKFIQALKVKNVLLDRKVLADLATNDMKAFDAVYEAVK